MPDHTVPVNCSPKDCPLTLRVEALERENGRHTETHKEIFKRLNKVEQDNAVQSEQYKTILEKLDTLTQKVRITRRQKQAVGYAAGGAPGGGKFAAVSRNGAAYSQYLI